MTLDWEPLIPHFFIPSSVPLCVDCLWACVCLSICLRFACLERFSWTAVAYGNIVFFYVPELLLSFFFLRGYTLACVLDAMWLDLVPPMMNLQFWGARICCLYAWVCCWICLSVWPMMKSPFWGLRWVWEIWICLRDYAFDKLWGLLGLGLWWTFYWGLEGWCWSRKVHTSGLMLCLGNGSLMQLFMVRLFDIFSIELCVWWFIDRHGKVLILFIRFVCLAWRLRQDVLSLYDRVFWVLVISFLWVFEGLGQFETKVQVW